MDYKNINREKEKQACVRACREQGKRWVSKWVQLICMHDTFKSESALKRIYFLSGDWVGGSVSVLPGSDSICRVSNSCQNFIYSTVITIYPIRIPTSNKHLPNKIVSLSKEVQRPRLDVHYNILLSHIQNST